MDAEEKWIDETMALMEQPPSMSPELMERLKSIPSTVKEKVKIIPMRTVWIAAASVAVLVVANIIALGNYRTSADNLSSENEEMVDLYFSHTRRI